MRGLFSFLNSAVKQVGSAGRGLHAQMNRTGVRSSLEAGTKLSTHMKIQGAFLAHTLFFSQGTPKERMNMAGQQVGLFLLTSGMKSGWRQGFWQAMMTLGPHMPDMGRGLVQGYRGVLESRTMASVPFSYSTLNMDAAWASMQYSQARMGDAYGALNGQAAMFSARYLQR